MNVVMIYIMIECMMSISICESNMSYYAYVLWNMLGEPIPKGIPK